MAKKSKKPEELNDIEKLKDPFDKLFRRSMQETKIAVELFKTYLPADLLANIDLSTLKLLNGSTLLKNLKLTHADCVYGCTIQGQDGFIILNCEHQSSARELMAFWMLKHSVGLMDNYRSQNKHKKLPIILQVVIYHGQRSPYPHSTEIWDCFENPRLAKRWALKPFQLIDLTVMSDEEIQKHNLFSAMETVFKHAREREVLDWVEKWLIQGGKLAIIYSKVDSEYAEDFIKCLMGAVGHSLSKEIGRKLLACCAEALPHIGDKIMNFAEQFKQEGHQQGLQQGEQFGRKDERHAIAKKMLEARVDLKTIKNCTGLSEQEIASLH